VTTPIAEWSLLNRLERIASLTQKHLKLAPARPAQLVTLDRVSESDFERIRMDATDESIPAASGRSTKVKSVSVPGVAAAPANFDEDLPAPPLAPAPDVPKPAEPKTHLLDRRLRDGCPGQGAGRPRLSLPRA
jgi:hypothetical protein